jgi:two-component system sensor histidine kinase MprB
LEEVDATMSELTMSLGLVAALGVLVAGGAGLAVARVVVRPVDRLTAAAEHVAATEDLDVPIEVPHHVRGRDEVARLSSAFNSMIERLDGSRRRQRQLIADSSHELRTPLTSLRTNIEWLMRADDRGRPLGPKQRRQVEQAVLGQVDELSALIGELGALARDEPVREHVAVELDQVVLRAVDRAQRRDPTRRFDLRIEPWPVLGDPAALERAVLNLLDNALKFSDGPVAVSLLSGHLAVYDTGAGLSDADQGNAFERFWRAPAARELPGSGLGLAIVADTIGRHGGTVFFTDAPGGGSRVGFTVPSLTELSAGPRETHI